METISLRYRFLWVMAAMLSTWLDAGFVHAENNAAKKWISGAHSFSDELGGFAIVGLTGRGSYDDPVVITQEIYSTGKSIITIRQVPALAGAFGVQSSWTTLHIQFRTLNRSDAGWIGFRFELQEELGRASIYGDGLSFNQLTRDGTNILSDKFSKYEVEFEPADRLVFNTGTVDRAETVNFTIFLLDLTPSTIFYIEQVPYLPAS